MGLRDALNCCLGKSWLFLPDIVAILSNRLRRVERPAGLIDEKDEAQDACPNDRAHATSSRRSSPFRIVEVNHDVRIGLGLGPRGIAMLSGKPTYALYQLTECLFLLPDCWSHSAP